MIDSMNYFYFIIIIIIIILKLNISITLKIKRKILFRYIIKKRPKFYRKNKS
jgi:hypothetical protein